MSINSEIKSSVSSNCNLAYNVSANYDGSNTKGNIKKINTTPNKHDIVIEEIDISAEINLLPISDIANEVLNGKWGNGDERKKRLEEAGYNADEVQGKVNEILTGVNTYVKVETITENGEEPLAEQVDDYSNNNSMGSKRILMAKKPEIIIDEFTIKETNEPSDISETSTMPQKEISHDSNIIKPPSNEGIKKVSIKTENTYDKLADASNDEYKFMGIFGENKTTGLNGDVILFDKIYKNEETGAILYYKDGKNVKYVSATHVIIVDGNNELIYYKDGSLEVKNTATDVTTYYDSNGIKIKEKTVDYSEGIRGTEIKHYDQNGNITKIELDSSYKEFDSNGNLIAEKTYEGSYIEYDSQGSIARITDKRGLITEYKEDGTVINYDSDKNIRKISRSDGSSITYNRDGTLHNVVQADGTQINYYDEYKYQEIKPDGSSATYELYENGNIKKISTPNGAYDSFYKEYDESGILISEKNEYAKITYVDGKPTSFDITARSWSGVGNKFTARTENGEYVIKLNQDGTKVLEVIDSNGNIIQDFGSGINFNR